MSLDAALDNILNDINSNNTGSSNSTKDGSNVDKSNSEPASENVAINNDLNATVDTGRYDGPAKTLLKHNEILAIILRYSVPEFRRFSNQQILDCVNKVVIWGESVATGLSSEDVALSDKTVRYDYVVYIRSPITKENTNILINIEVQNSYNPGYKLENRMTYYLARLLSRQLNVDKNPNYDLLKPCYSIWVCLSGIQKSMRGTLSYYRMFDVEDRDMMYKQSLMNGIIIRVSDGDSIADNNVKKLNEFLYQLFINRGDSSAIMRELSTMYSEAKNNIIKEVDTVVENLEVRDYYLYEDAVFNMIQMDVNTLNISFDNAIKRVLNVFPKLTEDQVREMYRLRTS